jgi:hypothetical protein
MTRTEIARRLHDMVDAWYDGPLATAFGDNANMAIRLTYGGENPITLVVGTETPDDDDRAPLRDDADDE